MSGLTIHFSPLELRAIRRAAREWGHDTPESAIRSVILAVDEVRDGLAAFHVACPGGHDGWDAECTHCPDRAESSP